MGFDPGKPTNVKAIGRVKKPKPATLAAPTPDQQDRSTSAPRQAHRARVVATVVTEGQREQARQQANARITTPDQVDRQRSPAQQAHDQRVVAATIKGQRVKVIQQQHAGELGRVPGEIAGVLHNLGQSKYQQHFSGPGDEELASINPGQYVSDKVTRFAKNTLLDIGELAVTTPSSVGHLVATAATHPRKLPGTLAAAIGGPYVQLYHHPLEQAFEHPVTTALMLDPAIKVPDRAVGRVLRATGKQTLERPPATLPGTALKDARPGSRGAVARALQSQVEKDNPAPVVTMRRVQRRVDEAVSAQRRNGEHVRSDMMSAAQEHAKTLPPQDRDTYLAEAEQSARDEAHRQAHEAYGREFGVNARPETGAAERNTTYADRVAAAERKKTADTAVQAANAEHARALSGARLARARAQRSSALGALEERRSGALREVVASQRAHSDAMAEFGRARGRAEVLSRNVAGPAAERRAAASTVPVDGPAQFAAGGRGVNITADQLQAATARVRTARDAVKDLDRQIAAERQRVSGVPPAAHDALVSAIHQRGEAQAEQAAARAEAQATRSTHIATKVQMRNAPLVDPESEGRLFDHDADARLAAKRLNENPVTIRRGAFTKAEELTPLAHEHVPVTFVVHKAGDRYSVIPDFVAERIQKHESIGSSKAPLAKVLRVSRGAFSRAILPTRPTWLSGQAVESVIRNGAMRAGPLSYFRARRLVAEMERQHPGSGQALLDRAVPAGKIGRVWSDFGDIDHIHTLKEEFPDNPVAAALTDLGRTPGVKQVRQLYHAVTTAVFHFNARFLERLPQTAMLGAALRDSPLMERSIIRLSDQAIADAANGLQETHAQVALARAVQRAFGKYSSFGPLAREAILYWTPFVAWALSSVRFLSRVLPVDHPVLAALVASANLAEQDWREANRLSLHGDHVPAFLLGSVPTHGGRDLLHLGHYSPFGLTDPTSDLGGLVLPQFNSVYSAIALGDDWTGKPLRHKDGTPFDDGERFVYGLTQLGESLLPLADQAATVAGAKDKRAAIRKELQLMSSSPTRSDVTHRAAGAYDGAVGSAYDTGGYSAAYGGS